jgi:hypothetical protein
LARTDAAAVAEFAEKVRGGLGDGVLEMRLFGSKALGPDVPGSDIDILMVVPDARVNVEDRILAIAFDVNLAHDVYISPRVVGRWTLEHPVWRITPFVRAALAGIPVAIGACASHNLWVSVAAQPPRGRVACLHWSLDDFLAVSCSSDPRGVGAVRKPNGSRARTSRTPGPASGHG